MKTNKLKFNPNNPRKCSKDKLEKLMRSIESFPEMMKLRPIVYDPETMHVLGGNQRLAAIRKLGMKDIPDEWTIAATDLTPEQQKEFVLRDNVQFGDWDFEMLSAEFGEFLDSIEEMGLDLPEIMSQDIDEKEQIIVPIKQVHYLVSVPLDKVLDAKSLISELKKIDGVKIEQSQN